MKIDMKGHTGFIGITQSGKTTLMNHLFKKKGGLFIDIEDKGEVQADRALNRHTDKTVFDNAIKQLKKIRYVPSPDTEKARKEARWISNRLLKLNKDIHVWVDEIQTYGSSRKNEFDVLAIRGLKHGIHLNYGTQRPAKVSKTIASQSRTMVFFDMSSFEKKGFKEYGLPYEEIVKKLESTGKPFANETLPYYFVIYTRGKEVSAPFKVRI